MFKYNVFFKIDSDIELLVTVVSNSEDRERVIYEARKKLEDRGHEDFLRLDSTGVDFIEKI